MDERRQILVLISQWPLPCSCRGLFLQFCSYSTKPPVAAATTWPWQNTRRCSSSAIPYSMPETTTTSTLSLDSKPTFPPMEKNFLVTPLGELPMAVSSLISSVSFSFIIYILNINIYACVCVCVLSLTRSLEYSLCVCIGEYAGLPLIPPYYQPDKKWEYGVNFASIGGGVLDDTHPGYVSDSSTNIKLRFTLLLTAQIWTRGVSLSNLYYRCRSQNFFFLM